MKERIPDNELPEDITLPPGLAVAFMSDRPELVKLWQGPMDEKTAKSVAHALGVLLEKNGELRRKLARYRALAENAIMSMRGQLNAAAIKMQELDADAAKALTEPDKDD